MKHRHVILEGKPTTGKTEISNLLKIFFPEQVKVLPELTTVLVRENKLKILEHRRELSELLREAVPARAQEVQKFLREHPQMLVLEESHMGVHWAYSHVVQDDYFFELYEQELKQHILIPDLFLRLDIPVGLSLQRQRARNTKDVEVNGEIVSQMFEHLQRWHREWKTEARLTTLDTNRPPEIVIRDLMEILDISYQVYQEDT